ncbi:MAG: hypothetical protein KGL39_13230 [Patescibacteria group bacterium]|nr:hypothetical protein [Patescibacteria group bacterium]
MITIREIDSVEAVRALAEHRAPKRYLNAVPLRERRLKPAPPSTPVIGGPGFDRLALPSARRRAVAPVAGEIAPAEKYPWKKPQQLTVRFKELLDDFMAARPEPFTKAQLDAWLAERGVNYLGTTLRLYMGLAQKEGLVVVAGETGSYHVNLYAAPVGVNP